MAEEILVEVLPEETADEVESQRIQTRVGEAECEADDAKQVPEHVVVAEAGQVEVEPEQEQVVGQKAHGKDHCEDQNDLGDLASGLLLSLNPVDLACNFQNM